MFRRVGEGTDVVSKEMYDFQDKGGRHIALRPEGTASIARAFVQHRPATPWKVWYAAPSFRYENMQAGRYRQHHQLGLEALGPSDPDLDVEVIALAWDYLRSLGLRQVRLLVNSMGTRADRAGLRRPAPRLARRAPRPARSGRPRQDRRPPHARPRLQAARHAGRGRRGAPHHPPPVARGQRALRPGARRAQGAGDPVHHRATPGARPRLLHAHHLRVRVRRARGRAEHRAGRWPLRRPRRGDGRARHTGHRLRVGRRARAAGLRCRRGVPHPRPQRRHLRRRHQWGSRGPAAHQRAAPRRVPRSTGPTTSAPCGRR